MKSGPGIDVRRNVSLARCTSFRIGGAAEYLVDVGSKKRLRATLRWLRAGEKRFIVIGGGTNVLFSDRGFPGAVVRLNGRFRRIGRNRSRFACGAGARLSNLVRRCRAGGYTGAEFLAGIPGSVGGAIKGNAGAWGHAISEIVESVTILDRRGVEKKLPPEAIGFGYRRSQIDDRAIILGAVLQLKKGRRPAIARRVEKYLRQRRARQPRGHSAGSFFKNPAGRPAGKLIDECGLKGFRIGDAMVSREHGNFIVNRGSARAGEVLKVARYVIATVSAKKGIRLEPEVRIIR